MTFTQRTAGLPAVLLCVITAFVCMLVVMSNTGLWGVGFAAAYAAFTFWLLRQQVTLTLDDASLTASLHLRERRIAYADIEDVAVADKIPASLFAGTSLMFGGPPRIDGADAFTLGGPAIRINVKGGDDCIVAVDDPASVATAIKQAAGIR